MKFDDYNTVDAKWQADGRLSACCGEVGFQRPRDRKPVFRMATIRYLRSWIATNYAGRALQLCRPPAPFVSPL